VAAMDEPKKPQILAIDDDAAILSVIELALVPENFRVTTFTNPIEALQFFESQRDDVDLVLLDYMMPEMNGDVAFGHLQKIKPDVKVILLTASEDYVAKDLFVKGLRAYFPKPFYLSDLIELCRKEIAIP
jgi:CheY-like chemotaxis protein